MEPKFQTSFIPKQSLEESATGRRPRGNLNLFVLIALLAFFASVAGALGVFLYDRLLEGSIASKKADLTRVRDAFEPNLIQMLSRTDERFQGAQELLNQHLALSELLTLLEAYTLTNLRFESFQYRNDEAGNITLSMRGRAKSYGSVALQAEVFAKVPFIKNPLVGSPTLDPLGNVLFDFSATIDPELLSYAAALKKSQ